MPATYQIDASRKLVLSKATGILTPAEMIEHQTALRSDPMFQPDYWQLFDFSETTEAQFTGRDIRRLAYDSPFRSGSRRAFVVPRPLLVGLANMFKTLTEDQGAELQLFDDLAEASRWLGIESRNDS